MIFRKTMYDKTQRLGEHTYEWLLTEKLDGSNLCFLKRADALYVCTRKRMIDFDMLCVDHGLMPAKEWKAIRDGLYNGLYDWLCEHGMDLYGQLDDGAAICGEWLGMGKIKYPEQFRRFNMFAKARIDNDLPLIEVELTHLDYDPDNFHFVFGDDALPDYIGTVPVIGRMDEAPSVVVLDRVYEEYAELVGRPVEGIVITQKEVSDRRCKYVRMKNGELEPHVTAEEMEERMREGLARRDAQRAKNE